MGPAASGDDGGLSCLYVCADKAFVLKMRGGEHGYLLSHFIVAIAKIALGAATLHGLETAAWVVLYIWLGAMPDAYAGLL